MTNQAKGYPFEVAVPPAHEMGGGVILCDQIKSMSWEQRNAAFAAKAEDEVIAEVMAKLKTLLPL